MQFLNVLATTCLKAAAFTIVLKTKCSVLTAETSSSTFGFQVLCVVCGSGGGWRVEGPHAESSGLTKAKLLARCCWFSAADG